jgi:predicted alpha/beta-hydrolase family hydrolase
MSAPQIFWNGPAAADCTILLAHGAGAGMDTPFMEHFAVGLAERGFRVGRFEFPYMAARREGGARRRPPDKEPVLRQTWLAAIACVETGKLVIGGKSMGGRIASLVAAEANNKAAGERMERNIDGLVCLGYPFHPTGKPEQLRVAHLRELKTPTLILQGDRDPFGNQEEVAGYALSPRITVHWLTDGDHSFKPRKASGRTEEANLNEALEKTAAFVRAL